MEHREIVFEHLHFAESLQGMCSCLLQFSKLDTLDTCFVVSVVAYFLDSRGHGGEMLRREVRTLHACCFGAMASTHSFLLLVVMPLLLLAMHLFLVASCYY